jgi:ATP-dependent Lon protease
VNGYTREAGVRNLEREIATLCRKTAKRKAGGALRGRVTITPGNLHRLLGPPRFADMAVERVNRIGVADGLAWTEVGGDMLSVEVGILPGKGDLQLTGKLGEVMRESGHAALTWIRSRAEKLGLDKWFYKEIDIHVHVPEGSIPKDGPSAGITIATALVSALTGVPTRADVSMTGEITLRGTVLAIGGLIEKALAARRTGHKIVVMPRANEKDLAELPEDLKADLEFVLVDTMDQVLEAALERPVPTRPAAPKSPDTRPAKDEGPAGQYAH